MKGYSIIPRRCLLITGARSFILGQFKSIYPATSETQMGFAFDIVYERGF
jgi:hypothetical protein